MLVCNDPDPKSISLRRYLAAEFILRGHHIQREVSEATVCKRLVQSFERRPPSWLHFEGIEIKHRGGVESSAMHVHHCQIRTHPGARIDPVEIGSYQRTAIAQPPTALAHERKLGVEPSLDVRV